MKKIPLAAYVKEHGQVAAAKNIGVTQGAISKALSAGREIFVWMENEKVMAEEVRPYPFAKSV